MATRIVHFGVDECRRLAVLSRAGYHVESSGTSISIFTHLLGREPADAVAISEDKEECDAEAVTLSRSLSASPIVLFLGVNRTTAPPPVDLVVDNGTPPSSWLADIEKLIQKSREIRRESKATRENSEELRQQSLALRSDLASVRRRSADELARAVKNLGTAKSPDKNSDTDG